MAPPLPAGARARALTLTHRTDTHDHAETRPRPPAAAAGYFGITEPLRHEGPEFRPNARRPFGYRWYDPERIVLGKRMEDQLRFAVC